MNGFPDCYQVELFDGATRVLVANPYKEDLVESFKRSTQCRNFVRKYCRNGDGFCITAFSTNNGVKEPLYRSYGSCKRMKCKDGKTRVYLKNKDYYSQRNFKDDPHFTREFGEVSALV